MSTNFDGSLVLRLKYAYGQVNLDRVGHWAKGGWIRLGQQPTPYFEVIEGIYRYRFQGTTFVERQGLLSSSDIGLSGHSNLPGGYGDCTWATTTATPTPGPRPTARRRFQLRASLRPLRARRC